ncbi:MAG TPA: hypothetical protein PLI27_00715 [Ignavibacteriales bacterium]|nr:hypothetical protein [Ignavibacteriales bacterium]HOM64488.1 hypothetical protein [Ignavibacteriales bacterium]HPD66585.1 hypothetical protein [Ignavibacteriales bacterium]HRR17635.1 hypothetical protein [Ignavibacteriales bacterium]
MEFSRKGYDIRVVEDSKKKVIFYVKKYPVMEIGKIESELINYKEGHVGSKIKVEGNFIDPDDVVDVVTYYYENIRDKSNDFDNDDFESLFRDDEDDY